MMNFYKKYFFLLLIVPLLAFSAHKYYISFTKIEYSEKSKAIQITMRVFIDDLENALKSYYKIEPKLDTKKEQNNINKYISKYINDKFGIFINGKKTSYSFLGKKYDIDEVKLYIEIEDVSKIESIEVKNNMLMELFEDQQNIIKLNINNKKKSFILTVKNDKDLLKF